MIAEQKSPIHRRRRTLVLWCALLLGFALAWGQWRAHASLLDTYTVALAQLSQMEKDALDILMLRAAPQQAAERARSTQELLAPVEQALGSTGIDRKQWRDSIPDPQSRVGDSAYKRLGTRLFFEDLTPRQLAEFADGLRKIDPTLRIASVHLVKRRNETPAFDVEVLVSYLVYSPQLQHETRQLTSSAHGRLDDQRGPPSPPPR